MAKYSRVPGFIRVIYSTTIGGVIMTHRMDIGIANPVWSGATTTIQKKDTTNFVWTAGVDALMVALRPIYHTSASFINAELYRQDTVNVAPTFVASYTINLAGTAGGSSVASCQAVWSCKAANGTLVKFTCIEPSIGADQHISYTNQGAVQKAVADFLIGAASWVYSRGNSFPIVNTYLTTKVNDKVRKLRMGL